MPKYLFSLVLLLFEHGSLQSPITGEFDGNGKSEKAWVITIEQGQSGNGEEMVYIPARRRIRFSSSLLPAIDIENAAGIYNIGDINQNHTDEILACCQYGLDPFDKTYRVYSFDKSRNSWRMLLHPAIPDIVRHDDPAKWVFLKGDTIFYWSSIQTLIKKDSAEMIFRDTLYRMIRSI